MICVSIVNRNLEQIYHVLDLPEVEMAEIRLDLCKLDDDQIEELFCNADKPLIATCRAAVLVAGGVPPREVWQKVERLLARAIAAGANYVDLELEAPPAVSKNIQKLCTDSGSELIRSWHDVSGTPDIEYLRQVRQRCYRYGADIAKIVTTARSDRDWETLAQLYAEDEAPLVAFCMGAEGRASRIACLKCGAPFTYAAVSEDEAAAPGQTAVSELYPEVFGEALAFNPGIMTMPASKSFAQRAILAAALSQGVTRLTGYTPCADSEAAIEIARALGAEISVEGDDSSADARTLVCRGIGPIGGNLPLQTVNVGESGLLARLMIPLLSQLCLGEFSVTGEGTLPKRALGGASDIMAAFGVMVKNLKERSDREIHVPLSAKGPLIPGVADIPGQHGSQLISGLLMSLPLCDKDSTVYVSDPKSLPYMFITCDVLKRFGVKISSEMEGDAQMIELEDWSYCSAVTFKIKGRQQYRGTEFALESDWSAAANFMVAGAVFGSVQIAGLDTSSLQADLGIVDILVDAGASVSELETGDICVRKAPLEAFDTDLNNAPDLFPIVSVLAAFCQGESRLVGARRLSGKESNRAAAIMEMLDQMGVDASLDGDVLCVRGESLASRRLGGRLLRAGKYCSHHDHRMAMALKVASLGADGPIEIDDEACVGKSFPRFFEEFNSKKI